MKLKQSSSSYTFLPFFVKFCALVAYAHINTLWPSIRGSVSQNLSVSYPVYISSSIIYNLAIHFRIGFFRENIMMVTYTLSDSF